MGQEQEALTVLAETVRLLLKEGWQVSLFPVWSEDVAICHEAVAAAGLARAAVDRLILEPEPFLDYVGQYAMVISLKLHAAVFAATAGVPFVAVEYQPKVRDFTDSIGWSDYTFRSDRLTANGLTRAVRSLFQDLATARSRLASRVEELRERLLAYAGEVEKILLS